MLTITLDADRVPPHPARDHRPALALLAVVAAVAGALTVPTIGVRAELRVAPAVLHAGVSHAATATSPYYRTSSTAGFGDPRAY